MSDLYRIDQEQMNKHSVMGPNRPMNDRAVEHFERLKEQGVLVRVKPCGHGNYDSHRIRWFPMSPCATENTDHRCGACWCPGGLS